MTASPDRSSGREEIVYLVRSWPRLSQTFVLDEVLGLERLGVPLRIVSLAASGETRTQQELERVVAPVHVLDEDRDVTGAAFGEHLRAVLRNPRGYLRAAWRVMRHRDWDQGYHVAGRWRCLTLALRLAEVMRAGQRNDRRVVHLHAHFAHDPAAVAMLTHDLTGVPWSFTGHARDVWQVPGAALAERVRSATFAVTCHQEAADRLRALVPAPVASRIRLVHHGVDLEAFRPGPVRRRVAGVPLRVVSVGRLTEKKGFDDLISACRLVAERGCEFRCTIYGDGPRRPELADLITRLGLDAVATLAGARTRKELLDDLMQADVFALTPYVTPDGDRDGIPNVVVEAMACGLPVVATAAGGITEIVRDRENGLLAAPRDVAGIADRLALSLADDEMRERLGGAARRTVRDGFDVRRGAGLLADLYRPALAGTR
ncbi:MAG: glycosyltransferase [Actinomycetes bacterium]